jgi:hypothetical protein
MCVGIWKVGLKNTQVACQKKTWRKKSSNGHNEWKKACLDVGFQHHKLKAHLLVKSYYFKKPWNIEMRLICVMDSKNPSSCKVVYQISNLYLNSRIWVNFLCTEQCCIYHLFQHANLHMKVWSKLAFIFNLSCFCTCVWWEKLWLSLLLFCLWHLYTMHQRFFTWLHSI